MPPHPPLSPEDRQRVYDILRTADPALALRYEGDAATRDNNLDVVRYMLAESRNQTFAEVFTGTMARVETALTSSTDAIKALTTEKQEEAKREQSRWSSLWGPKGTVIAVMTVVITNIVTLVGTLAAAGVFTDPEVAPPSAPTHAAAPP